MADALIAASAMACGLPILTGNYKHYKILGGDIDVQKFTP
jgi:predicted nucleic acid-binding protein